MFALLKSKIAIAVVGCIVVGSLAAIVAVGTITHAGPFGVNTTQQSLQGGDGGEHGTKTAGTPGAQGQETHVKGQIKSVTFATGGTTAGTLVVLPTGQTQTVTVQFTAQTKVEVTPNAADDESNEGSKGTPTAEKDDSHGTPTAGHDASHGTPTPSTNQGKQGAAGLTVGLSVEITGTKQADGSVLAKEIQGNDNEGTQQDDDGTPSPKGTPEPGEDHGTPSPKGTPSPDDGHGTPQAGH